MFSIFLSWVGLKLNFEKKCMSLNTIKTNRLYVLSSELEVKGHSKLTCIKQKGNTCMSAE